MDSKLNQKYSTSTSAGTSDAIHTLANGHQMISTLPRDSKWEKKKVRALNLQQHKGSLDTRSLILASPPPPPMPGSYNTISSYPLPLLSLPSQTNMSPNGDMFAAAQEQDAADFFLHHRHHLHLHQHHQHIIDPTESSNLLLSTLNHNTLGANSIDYHHHLLANERSSGFVTSSGLEANKNLAFQSACNDAYLFNATENACSHCNYELYDCHNNLDLSANTCDLMLLPASTTYHHLHHHPMYSGDAGHPYHQCSTSISNDSQQPQFSNNNNWAGYSVDSIDYHQSSRPDSKHQDHNELITRSAASTLPMSNLIDQELTSNQMNNEVNCGNKSGNRMKSTEHTETQDDAAKSDQFDEAPNEAPNTRQTGPRLQRTKSFTVEEDLSEIA